MAADDRERFIVAEVSKNWINGMEARPGSGLLSEQFEQVINRNAARGYRLVDWRLDRQMNDYMVNETIIAVFEQV